MCNSLSRVDPEVREILQEELFRQQKNLTLIPSENYTSKAVLEAESSVLINKYAEGYPQKRYYQGCQFGDEIEELAIQRAKKLFKCEHVNVQVHSGTQANMAVYQALLKPGDVILSLNLSAGGHLSHGKEGTFPYKYHRIVNYGVDKDSERFNYDEIRRIARRYRPRLIIVGASAYPRAIDFLPWRKIADEVGAYLLADVAHIIGLIVAGLHPDPVPYADVVTATTQKTLRGPRGGIIICQKKYASVIDKAVFPGIQGGPFMHTIAAKAVCFKEASQPEFKEYQRRIISNAKTLARVLKEEGFRLVSDGTDNHLMIVDLSKNGITGREAATILEEAGIIVNKNNIPFDKTPPSVTSGIRLGTPAVTTRGMGSYEMELIGEWISRILHHPQDKNLREKIKEEVEELCEKFPIYKDLE
ncbi:serine hydroxymethyltransferase [Candidatus Aerophobetes bacterium]|uniref:Probable serine hydroxymethyltransferase n=1 Tax=Aerophobetes bacterium TaxID=2030807 RepID=A0A662D4G9_UNCAE|nr:MAG: serine hydroxymethyltransferase [Candidatus Aerophobetes bacterium]